MTVDTYHTISKDGTMSLTLHTIDGQEITITYDNLIGVVVTGLTVGVIRVGDSSYTQVVESYDEIEPFLDEITY
jgi:hypothetical protein